MEVGGAERLVFDSVLETNHEMFNVEVCCLDETGMLGEELIGRGYIVTTLERSPGIDMKFILTLRRLLRERRIDIIHAHQYTSFFYAAIAKEASEIVSISEATKEAMVRHDNFLRNKIRVIHNGVKFMNSQTDRALKHTELGVAPDDFVLTTAARLDAIKISGSNFSGNIYLLGYRSDVPEIIPMYSS